jgi:hypothetical protein
LMQKARESPPPPPPSPPQPPSTSPHVAGDFVSKIDILDKYEW